MILVQQNFKSEGEQKPVYARDCCICSAHKLAPGGAECTLFASRLEEVNWETEATLGIPAKQEHRVALGRSLNLV